MYSTHDVFIRARGKLKIHNINKILSLIYTTGWCHWAVSVLDESTKKSLHSHAPPTEEADVENILGSF